MRSDRAGSWLPASILLLAGLGCHSGGEPKATETAPGSSGKAASPGSVAVKVSRDNPCSVLHPKEVQEIIGMPVPMREVVDESTCHFHFEPGEPSASSSAAPAGKGKAVSEEQNVEEMSKTLAGAAFGGGHHIIGVTMHWTDGRTAIVATRMAGKMLGGEMKDAFRKLEGIGDEA
ncbi:MAG: DUF3558 domain-containing protein [Acidimicrobiia bacterium]|nr:DUF3558 domain-containing protein [Acidimicrobiia bacterium]